MAIKSLLLRKRVPEKTFLDSLQKFTDFFNEAKTGFIKRDEELDILSHMLMSAEHGIMVGPPGTAKTKMWDNTMNNVTDVKLFQIEVNPFMGEDALFGPYDFKLMKEKGILHHNTENTLADANLARVGEALDANVALQRSKLSALNERTFNRGTQQLDLLLHSTYMDTNKEVHEHLRQNPHAWAYIDRILFIRSVGYLEDHEDIAKMVELYQYRGYKKMTRTISLEDIRNLAECIVSPPSLISDRYIFSKYAKAISAYRTERKKFVENDEILTILPEISDRRIDKVSQIMEIAAVRNGRRTVKIEDMQLCHTGLCHTDKERELWNSLVDDAVKAFKAMKKDDLSKLQSERLKDLKTEFDDLKLAEIMKTATEDQTRIAIDVVKEMILQLGEIVPENDQVAEYHKEIDDEMRKSLQDLLDSIQQIILNGGGRTCLIFLGH